jgi:hypothetical protein
MHQCNAAGYRIETASAPAALLAASAPGEETQHAAYIGMDVHKETMAIAVAQLGREEPIDRGAIVRTPKKVETLIA